MVHCNCGVVIPTRAWPEDAIRCMRSAHRDAGGLKFGKSRCDDLDFLAPHGPAFSGVRIKPGKCQPWIVYSEACNEIPHQNHRCLDEEGARQQCRDLCEWDM